VTRAWREARSVLLWALSGVHFAIGTFALAAATRIVGRRRLDPWLKRFCRVIVALAGARYRVERSPRVDPDRVYVYVANHVNLFDPFTICGATPGWTSGFELESHFDVPIYGLLMRSFGNVPVPDRASREGILRMRERTEARLAEGCSLILFPEGTRTRTGALGPFRPGALRLVAELGVPIVPVTQVGAFELQHPGKSRLDPARITVILHDPVETKGLARADLEGLTERIRTIIGAPLARGER
jgi:1-acyl-sn-glycerol-3-phosphate acyltransferase